VRIRGYFTKPKGVRDQKSLGNTVLYCWETTESLHLALRQRAVKYVHKTETDSLRNLSTQRTSVIIMVQDVICGDLVRITQIGRMRALEFM
jgi:hypothetical protein